MTAKKYVYDFAEGGAQLKSLLGGKGANLCEMTQIGLNVPPGFVISTEACLAYLARERRRRLALLDVGCGSGRLHLRYGIKTAPAGDPPPAAAEARRWNPTLARDPDLAQRLASVAGLDFSAPMLELARRKLSLAGFGSRLDRSFRLIQGSAFDLQPMAAAPFPVAVSLCNSVGVMQGPEGAGRLFQAMRRAVEAGGGLAVISGYCREAVASHALGNYESTLDVSGQPRWLVPSDYASPDYRQVARAFKRAHDPSPDLLVDVYDRTGARIRSGHRLTRDADAARRTAATGHILTHTDYTSYWYSTAAFAEWIRTYWRPLPAVHLLGKTLDRLRGEPMHLAILDVRGELRDWFGRRGIPTGKE